ncbi:C6 zinc finger domain protein [Aspergillus costaricaensis CBS 115574]|uniref:C6 zinc finger domain protein n=1 Tax=Aspergillus costaricaensis CBS 115574 TaxID=1448317 RepID=A0ACD1IEF2_9EURO|nr:C6 zinc finger domain protein [Aspergillus costaricaensis CBS 115574]RAK88129.1 C6 zinc finger domain protein [Aspergillus costaricaensis CBS 115574]
MDSDEESSCAVSAPVGKKRIPVKCDGKGPCTRCKRARKRCVFFEIPKDPAVLRLENVEAEVQRLREKLSNVNELLLRQSTQQQQQIAVTSPASAHFMSDPGTMPAFLATGGMGGDHDASVFQYQTPGMEAARPTRLRRSGFDIKEEPVLDFISRGMMTADQAMSCFRTFFQGCDRYIPVFDPDIDTFNSVRARSSILFNAICTIGSRVEIRSGSQIPDLLHAELKRSINVIIQNKNLNCLESVQALLVVACYSAERSLILSFATRMALDLGLDEAFEELIQRLTMKETEGVYDMTGVVVDDEERTLMRKSRTWFGLLVLDHIFHVDGGKPPGIRVTGNAHRCRILLRHHTSTVLDLRLFSQVEVSMPMVARVNDTLDAKETLQRSDITEFVHEAKVDIDLWFDDWLRIIENSPSATQERPFLLAALRVQKCWAELILHCKALRSMGVGNVAEMSPIEQTILLTAKSSARKHLRLISLEPDFYLAKLKYAMDFVWAKCAFCFLLLLKLSRLVPEQKEEHKELLDHGNRLLDELTRTNGESAPTAATATTTTTGIGNNNNIYMQILRLSIEKYSRVLQEREVNGASIEEAGEMSSGGEGGNTNQPGTNAMTPFWELFDAQADLQSFVPEQFVREWDFPGLDLFYFPTAWQDFFGDFSLAV